jgi:soluble cytochrome b562
MPRNALVFLLLLPVFLLTIFLSSVPSARAQATSQDNPNKNASPPLILRWSESRPGCTFSRGDDGKYRYGLWSGDVGVVLAVDAREVQIITHRVERFFGVLLTIHYRGASSLDPGPDGITLQFMKHFKVVQSSLDPDDYTQKVQADADAFDDETRREIAKHPEQKQRREAQLQDYQKSINELIEFLGRNSLRTAHLDPANREANGWVLFDTENKWLGKWKAQEEFVLRVPLDGKIYEFPFKLPPQPGELLLQKRQ